METKQRVNQEPEWLDIISPEQYGYVCSNCGRRVWKMENICPGCGEKMVYKGRSQD